MTYDEEFTPEIDPPLSEPPPSATILGRVFAHRVRERTVVQAPLVRMPGLADPDVPAATPARDTVPEVVPEVVPEAVPEVVSEVVPEAVPEAEPDIEPEEVAAPVATRFCPVCDDRVPVAADGLHCHLGHRLSPAHGRSRHRWLGRRGS